jgi:hypothetical protein
MAAKTKKPAWSGTPHGRLRKGTRFVLASKEVYYLGLRDEWDEEDYWEEHGRPMPPEVKFQKVRLIAPVVRGLHSAS